MSQSESSPDAQARSRRIQAIANDCLERRAAGEELSDESIIKQYPELMPELAKWLRAVDLLQAVDDVTDGVESPDRPFNVAVEETLSSGSGSTVTKEAAEVPTQIGRYKIEKTLGTGAFGRVFLAHDERLGRPVAIKVPHARVVSGPSQAEAYLTEARTIAGLDHTHIVPVHDVGRTDEFPFFMVCKYVEGSDLASKLKQSRLTYKESVELVATVAEALHYAHKHGLVHRDVKPGNILIGNDGEPYVVDFGLALQDGSIGKGPRYAGTPAYMSPEQARGEGHRVDGRSDIFSLGVVLYELLVGRRPFRGDTQTELFDQISTHEPRPVRQYDEQIPRELERICYKALVKRARDRYSTAKDFAEDLREILAERYTTDDSVASDNSTILTGSTSAPADSTSTDATDLKAAIGSGSSLGSQPLKIVPKGLRSFDAHDADFFLELLPGPRDRNGLPDSIRFWKTRIEEVEPDRTFSIGLIYGPSGCGKSSLVKAGLLPRLSENVIVAYLEATAEDTETRLLHSLRRRCDALDDRLGLHQTMAALRRGENIRNGQKVLIVLDQFEQWLHANKDGVNAELVQALRQCDGARLQCIVMVRDDFWLAATRFMDDVEVDLAQGRNSALADLFDVDHARKVLAAFGRAFGKLPEEVRDTSKQQREFLKQSAQGLAEDGKVVCVRLALFAEMMKGKAWTPTTLKEVGGTQGIGVAFLDETFSAPTAHPKHRLHQQAAHSVLKALLPEADTDIKGQMKSYGELLEASGYARRSRDFDDLIQLLDSELRLITPTEKDEGGRMKDEELSAKATSDSSFILPPSSLYFQLTHDYLVPSLRDWLTRKQRETRRGRAELCLAERDALWSGKPLNRLLPSLGEYLRIAGLTERRSWSASQHNMMRKAARVHGLRVGSALLVVVAILVPLTLTRHRSLSRQLEKLIVVMENSRGLAVPLNISELGELPPETVLGQLEYHYEKRKTLPLAYARADVDHDRVDVDFIVSQIPTALPEEVDNLVTALGHDRDKAVSHLIAEAKAGSDWKHKTRLAVVALHLGDMTLAAEMCQIEARPDPVRRTAFIHHFPSWHGDLGHLLNKIEPRISDSSGPSIDLSSLRSALCAAVGSMEPDQFADAKQKWAGVFKEWFVSKRDKETHCWAGWALRKWGEEPNITGSKDLPTERDWHVNTEGMTMVKIPEGNFNHWYNLKDEQDESYYFPKGRLEIELTKPFWMADRPVTVDQFRRFTNDQGYHQKPPAWPGHDTELGPTDDHPVQNVSWYDAVLFCNWLSWREKLKCCYVRSEKPPVEFVTDDHLPPDQQRYVFTIDEVNTLDPKPNPHMGPGKYVIWDLNREADGYRLPTEAEWERACRAGTDTVFGFGNELGMVSYYVAFAHVKCGSKLPNGWGLFDMHGNAWEYCHDWWDVYDSRPQHAGGPIQTLKNPIGTTNHGKGRATRGGGGGPPFVTSHIRDVPTTPNEIVSQVDALRHAVGFRVARNHPR